MTCPVSACRTLCVSDGNRRFRPEQARLWMRSRTHSGQVTGLRTVRPTNRQAGHRGFRTRTTSHHHRGDAHPAPRHRPRRDSGVDRVARRRAGRTRQGASSLPHAQADRASPGATGGGARAAEHGLHQLDPARAGAVVPRRRAHRAADPGLHPVERRGDGVQGEPQGPGGRRSHRHLPVRRQPVRGRFQPLLPRQGPPGRWRPGLHPGARLAGYVRPRLPRGPASSTDQLDGFRQEVSRGPHQGLSSYPHPG